MTTLLADEAEAPQTAEAAAAPWEESGPRCDTLAESVMMLVLLTLVQPVIGFGRSILFCRWLSPGQIGQWDVAQGFLILAAPLVVWGIPGSFGRYVAFYRRRGQLKSYLTRATWLCALLVGAALVSMGLFPAAFAQLIFGEPAAAGLMPLVISALAIVIAYGYVTELLTALRLFRVVSVLQLLRSVGFLAFGVALFWGWQFSSSSVIAAYALSSLLAIGLGLYWIRWAWRLIDDDPVARPVASVLRKVAPFALWVWLSNALSNLFEVVDRYMLVHFGPWSAEEMMREVGNYHSSRVVPLLLVAFANTLASMLLPHFSHRWESGDEALVGRQRNLVLKIFGVLQLLFAVLVLLSAPWLFGDVLEGKYAGGQAVLPWTLVYCIWFCLALMCESTLWCAEEARLGTVALVIGMAVTIGLNLLLLPRYGLLGAVWGTAAGKLTLMLVSYGFNRAIRVPVDRGAWIVSIAPLSLICGPWIAVAVFLLLAVLATTTRLVLTDDDQRLIKQFVADRRQRWQKFRRRGGSSLAS